MTDVDWARIADWAAHIAHGDLASIGSVFASHDADPPEVVWQPGPETLQAPPLRFLAEHWSGLAGGKSMPHATQVDALELRPALGYIMLLDVVDGGRDFRYRLYGSTIARISDFDMTGRLLSEHAASAYVAEFAIAVHRAALKRREPVYTSRQPAAAQFASRWQRLALPLSDDSGTVVRVIAGKVPIARDGSVIS